MASSSNANMIHFPRLPSLSPAWDTTGDSLLPAGPLPPRAGRSLKQSRSTESLTQRKDRVEFLRRREWTRRVAASGDHPAVPTRRERTYSWEDIIAAADAAASTFDYNSSGYITGRPDTIDETDEDEPYVIYTASPRAPSASFSPSAANPFPLPSPHAYVPNYTPHTPAATVIYSTSPSPPPPSHSPTSSPASSPVPSIGIGGTLYNRRASWRGPHSRHSSLSSISEEDEGLARF